ncbi:hypothetical protein CF326_g10017 [Tilletia indica]|nr:hypothetical protein CF326_g10017 [Tilletia indica]
MIYPLVVIALPFLALLHDAYQQATASGLKAHIWTSDDSESTISADVQVVLVTPERLLTPSCTQFTTQLKRADRLGAIIFDEAHVYILDFYRASTHSVMHATGLSNTRYIFLSATLSPTVEHLLVERLHLGSLAVVRAPTWRPNIHYRVEVDSAPVGAEQGRLVELGVAAAREQLAENVEGAVLVICRTREMAEKVAVELNCGVRISIHMPRHPFRLGEQ